MAFVVFGHPWASGAQRISRRQAAGWAVIALAVLPAGCKSFELLTDNCTAESVLVAWPATITRGNATTTMTLTGAVSPGNIDPSQFNQLKQLLTTGGAGGTNSVVWTVPAFNVNGGYIAFMHKAPLTSGQSEPVNLAFDGGGWGIVTSRPDQPFPAVIAVRAENFVATSASGSITAIAGPPLRLRIDVTARNASNETMRLMGEAQFRYERARTSCS